MLRFIKYLFSFGLAVCFAVALALAYIIYDTSKTLPSHESLAQYEPPVMTRIHAADGSLLAEYAKAPEVTRRRIYIETLQDVMPGIRSKIIIDEQARSILPLLNLDARKVDQP